MSSASRCSSRHRQGVTITDAGRQLLRESASCSTRPRRTSTRPPDSRRATTRTGFASASAWGLWDAVNRIRVESRDAVSHRDDRGHRRHLRRDSTTSSSATVRSTSSLRGRPSIRHCLEVVPLFHERLVAVVSDDSPLASRKTLRIQDLANEPLLLYDRHVMPVLCTTRSSTCMRRRAWRRSTIPTPDAGPYNHAGLMSVASGKGVYVCIGIPLTSPHPVQRRRRRAASAMPTRRSTSASRGARAKRRRTVLQFLNCVWQVFPQARQAPVIGKGPRAPGIMKHAFDSAGPSGTCHRHDMPSAASSISSIPRPEPYQQHDRGRGARAAC